MSVNKGNFAELLEPGLKEIYGLQRNQFPEQYSRVFEVRTSTKSSEHTLSMTGMGLMPIKGEGQGIAYDDPIQGFKQTLTNVTYGLGFIVTEEMYEDDQYGKINMLPKMLARSERHTVETVAANVLNNAFSNSYTGADGIELCATNHKLEDGGTFANELAVSADLSMSSFEQALIDIADFVDGRGLLMAAKPTKLVIPPELRWTAEQILNSAQWPENGNNAVNPAKGLISFEVMNFLTDPDAWFVLTDVLNGLVFYWRRNPKFGLDNDFDSGNAKYKTTMRFVCGWDDPRGIYGSPGS